jgi:serine/threonine-protein kinase
LPFARIGTVLGQTLAAVTEAHRNNIVHGDLKPENIIVEALPSGHDLVKVVDFGLARMGNEAHWPSTAKRGIVSGTSEYMSPEQARGDPIDARSDIYSVGVILYELLNGRLPCANDSRMAIERAHWTAPPEAPREMAPQRDVPPQLHRVALRALAKDPTARFQSANELSTALRDGLEHVEGCVGALEQATPAPASGFRRVLNHVSQRLFGAYGAPVSSTLAESGARSSIRPGALQSGP